MRKEAGSSSLKLRCCGGGGDGGSGGWVLAVEGGW